MPGLRWIGYALVPAVLVGCIATWAGLPSLLSTAGSLLIALGRAQAGRAAMRWLVLAGMPFWLVHDVLIASPIVVADVLSPLLGIVAIAREKGWLRRLRPSSKVTAATRYAIRRNRHDMRAP